MEELAYSGSADAAALRSRMTRCGGEEWNYQFSCRTPACATCRGRYIGRQRRAAIKRFAKHENHDLAFASIVIGATDYVDEIGETFMKFRKDLRNIVDANRRQRRRWNNFEALLWLETDALSGDDFVHLGSDKKAQLGEMAPLFVRDSGPVWVVTAHGVIARPGIDYQEVAEDFRQRWPGTKRVDVRPFYDHQTKDQNLGYTINYALKHECRTHLGQFAEPWPMGWMAEYYSYLNRWSRGFQSTRISISPKEIKSTNAILPKYNKTETEELEPLPFIYSDSVFHTYYNWKDET
ncbi:MAG: hypothetical protein ABS77_09785 [Phenylobacterium sp. SCN 69-14]|nr:MAG: hypothetical protein ABS77_09785 [Phenylobacterium sp. SCN 69-14]